MKRSLAIFMAMTLMLGISAVRATGTNANRATNIASATGVQAGAAAALGLAPGKPGLPPGWNVEHHVNIALGDLMPGGSVGPEQRTNGGKDTITGWHHPIGAFQAWAPNGTVTHPPDPTYGPNAGDPVPANCSAWYNVSCWTWFGQSPGCSPGIPLCGLLMDSGLAPTISNFVLGQLQACAKGTLNTVTNTWIAMQIVQRYSMAGLAVVVTGARGWAAVAIGGCIFGLAFFQ